MRSRSWLKDVLDQVDRIVDAEMKTFKALDYLSRYSIPDVQLVRTISA